MWQEERTGSDGHAVPAARPAADGAAGKRGPGPPAAGSRPEPTPEPTGDARVDAAVRPLVSLADSSVREHAEIFERVHAELVDILGELDTSQADGTRQAGAS
jgi:hypothetical protein